MSACAVWDNCIVVACLHYGTRCLLWDRCRCFSSGRVGSVAALALMAKRRAVLAVFPFLVLVNILE